MARYARLRSMDLWRYEQYRIGIQRFDWRMGFTCFGGHGAAAQVRRGLVRFGCRTWQAGMMMATDGAPQQAGVEAEAQALTHDTLVALVDNRDYQRLALLYVAAKLDLADALRGGRSRAASWLEHAGRTPARCTPCCGRWRAWASCRTKQTVASVWRRSGACCGPTPPIRCETRWSWSGRYSGSPAMGCCRPCRPESRPSAMCSDMVSSSTSRGIRRSRGLSTRTWSISPARRQPACLRSAVSRRHPGLSTLAGAWALCSLVSWRPARTRPGLSLTSPPSQRGRGGISRPPV